MDPKSQDLLNELNVPKKNETPGAPAKKEGRPTIQNASADELLSELGVSKKKSSSPDSSGGGAAPSTSEPAPPAAAGGTSSAKGAGSAAFGTTPEPVPSGKQAGGTAVAGSVAGKFATIPAGKQGEAVKRSQEEKVKSAQEFIKEDYLRNRDRIDPVFTNLGYDRDVKDNNKPMPKGGLLSPRLPGAPVTQYPIMDQRNTRFLQHVVEGQSQALKDYFKTRSQQLTDDYKTRINALEKKYPSKIVPGSGGPGMVPLSIRENKEAYEAERLAIETEIQDTRKQLNSAVDQIANRKLFAEAKKAASPLDVATGKFINPEKLGKEKLRLLGDPNMDKVERYQAKGLPVNPATLYDIDREGLRVAKAALIAEMDERGTKDAEGKITSIPEDLKKTIAEVDKQEKGLLQKHGTFRKQQVARAISDKIYKDKNFFQTMTGAYTINQKDIKRAAKELGFNEDLISDVKPGDIKTANMFGQFVTELAIRPGGAIGALVTRNFRKQVLGQDDDYVDVRTELNTKKFNALAADAPDAQQQFGTGTVVDTDSSSESFLEDVQNSKKGKFNWNVDAIANTVAGGFGQLLTYAYGGAATGTVLKGAKLLGKAATADKARDAGLLTYSFITQYDPNYQQAKDMGITNEAAANGFATLRSLASALTEKIFPDYKVTDALFGPKSAATKQFMDLVAKKGIEGLTQKSLAPILKAGIKEGLKNTGKEVGEEEVDLGADVLLTAMFKPEALADRDLVTEAIETGLHTAIGTILPVTAAAFRGKKGTSRMNKNMMYHVGLNPEQYINAIDDEVTAGNIPEQEGNKRIQIVKRLSKIVDQVPDISSETESPLSEKDKVDYANNMLEESLLTEELEKVKDDEVQSKSLTKRIAALKEHREAILNNASGKEYNDQGDPLVDDEAEEGDDAVAQKQLDWNKNYHTEKLKSQYDFERERAKKQLDLLQNDPIAYYQAELDLKGISNPEENYWTGETRERLQKTLDYLTKKQEAEKISFEWKEKIAAATTDEEKQKIDKEYAEFLSQRVKEQGSKMPHFWKTKFDAATTEEEKDKIRDEYARYVADVERINTPEKKPAEPKKETKPAAPKVEDEEEGDINDLLPTAQREKIKAGKVATEETDEELAVRKAKKEREKTGAPITVEEAEKAIEAIVPKRTAEFDEVHAASTEKELREVAKKHSVPFPKVGLLSKLSDYDKERVRDQIINKIHEKYEPLFKARDEAKMKAPLTPEEDAVVQAIKTEGKLTEVMGFALDESPREVIKEIQDQATNTNSDGSPSDVNIPAPPIETLERMYGKKAVKMALDLLPGWEKDRRAVADIEARRKAELDAVDKSIPGIKVKGKYPWERAGYTPDMEAAGKVKAKIDAINEKYDAEVKARRAERGLDKPTGVDRSATLPEATTPKKPVSPKPKAEVDQEAKELQEAEEKLKELGARKIIGGGWRAQFNESNDAFEKSAILRAIAETPNVTAKELSEIVDAAEGMPNEANIIFDVLNKRNIDHTATIKKVLAGKYDKNLKLDVEKFAKTYEKPKPTNSANPSTPPPASNNAGTGASAASSTEQKIKELVAERSKLLADGLNPATAVGAPGSASYKASFKRFKQINKEIAELEASKPQPAEVFFAPLSSINTDTKRFQPRGTDFSKESTDKIVNGFDDNRLDPIVIYKDKSAKDFVLSGHSRYEAHKVLDAMPDTDPVKQAAIAKGYQPGKVKARYFNGTEAEAIEFADRSNDLGTKNKDYESAASLRKMREAGKTKTEIQARAKEDFGKNWRYIFNLSYLNPKGKIITTLQQFEGNTDKDGENKIIKAAQWIGAVLERMGQQLSTAHETEMFDFLMDKGRSTKIERENDFIALVQNIVGRFDFAQDEPLNLARIKNKPAGEVAHDIEEAEIKNAIKEKESELDALNDRFNNPKNSAFISPSAPDYQDVLKIADQKKQKINLELTALRKELVDHKNKKGQVIADGMAQFGLFDMNNLTPAEKTEAAEELAADGITLENIQEYEQSNADTGTVPEENSNDQPKAGTVSQNVQQSKPDAGSVPQQNPGGATVPVVDPELQAKIDKKNELLKKFQKKVGGQLGVGLDPEVITLGVELMASYVDIGFYKFRAIVKDAIDNLGKEAFKDEKFIEALKGTYSYYRSAVPKDQKKEFENEDSVDEFVESELPALLEEEKEPVDLDNWTDEDEAAMLQMEAEEAADDTPLGIEMTEEQLKADQEQRQRDADQLKELAKKGSGVFPPPPGGKTNAEKDATLIPIGEAEQIVKSWKKEAKRIGRDEDRSNQVVISMFDYTGGWSQPYVDAGYTVLQFDIQHEGEYDIEQYEDILEAIERGETLIKIGGDILRDPMNPILEIRDALKAKGKVIDTLLSATPCTTYAGSGAQHWPKHDKADFDEMEKRFGIWAAKHFDTPNEYMLFLTATTELWVEETGVPKFAMENPVGRIAEANGLPEPTLQFNPNIYGDPYTKKTQVWGVFNPNLPKAPVAATEGSKMQQKYGSKNKVERSITPAGFAYSFFIANAPNELAKADQPAAPSSEPPAIPEVTFKTFEGKKVTGRLVQIKGLEGLDTVVVKEGMVYRVTELASGMQIADDAFTPEEAIEKARAEVTAKGLTAERILQRLYNTEQVGRQTMIINESPGYIKYKADRIAQEAADYEARPLNYTPEEQQRLRELAVEAEGMGAVETAAGIEKEIDRKVSSYGKGTRTVLNEDLYRSRMRLELEKKAKAEAIANRAPLPNKYKEFFTNTDQDFTNWLNQIREKGADEWFYKFGPVTRGKIRNAYDQQQAIKNHFGYTPNWMKMELYISITIAWGTMNARNEDRKNGLANDLETLDDAIDNINYWAAREIYKEINPGELWIMGLIGNNIGLINDLHQKALKVFAGRKFFQGDNKGEIASAANYVVNRVREMKNGTEVGKSMDEKEFKAAMLEFAKKYDTLRDAEKHIDRVKDNLSRDWLPDVEGLSPISEFKAGELVVDGRDGKIYEVGVVAKNSTSVSLKRISDNYPNSADPDEPRFRPLNEDELQAAQSNLEGVLDLPAKAHPFLVGLVAKAKAEPDAWKRNRLVTDAIYDLAGDSKKKLRQEIYSTFFEVNKLQPITKSGVNNILEKIKKYVPQNDTGTATNLESNSTRTGSAVTTTPPLISNTGERDSVSDTADGEEIISEGLQPAGSERLLPFDATTKSEPADTELSSGEQSSGSEGSTTGLSGRGGSDRSDEGGTQAEPEPVFGTEGTIGSLAGRTIEQAIEEQKAAEPIPVVIGDLQNIRATLPLLMPAQQEDVYAAEKRFFGAEHQNEEGLFGKGILFTNGTGTGKTLTGLGIAKRFVKQGKTNGLIVVPSDAKIADWQQEASDYMGMTLNMLKGVKDAGEGAVITTYANFRENYNLQQRTFDWVIYDESHKINSNGEGSKTTAELVHKQVTKTPQAAREVAKKNINFDARERAINQAMVENKPLPESRKELEDELYNETIKVFKLTKVVYLSATPFSYHKSLEYADGSLFKILSEFRPTHSPGQYNSFYISNFGYRIRYNKLTQPESGVDVGLMERMFTEGLKKKGIVVARKLKIDQDYSRQFIIVEDGIGSVIDQGLEVLRDRDLFPTLSKYYHKQWNYLYTSRLMEALKARAYVKRIEQHLELDRKIVLFHNFNEGMPHHPFNFNNFEFLATIPDNDKIAIRNDIERFESEYPQYAGLDLKGLRNPIETIMEAFPGSVELFNGTIPKAKRKAAKANFQKDGGDKPIIIVQTEAGKEGLSLHDKTGKHQRVMANLGLPVKPTDAIQTEGRIYRTGQKSNAVIEYPILNLNFERFAFASKIKDRVKTAENLALGEEARNLEVAFKEGYIGAVQEDPSEAQGTGGKQEDARMDATSEFEKSKSFYWKRQKRKASEKKYVSGDYYGTPEPLGYKMVEWMNLAPNEKAMEPSGGHGAIARFFPGNTTNLFIEPNSDLRAELALNAIGETKSGTFEDLNIINKFDGIAMNPPFGSAGKMAMDHMLKALGHLRDFGRTVALVPVGASMQKRIDAWLESDASNGYYIRARIKLPSVTFERAGTAVNTEILIIDKINDPEIAETLGSQRQVDLTYIENIKDLFETIEDMGMPERLQKGKFAPPPGMTEEEAAKETAPATTEFGIPTQGTVGEAAPTGITEVVKSFHAKAQKDIWVVKMVKRVGGEEFSAMREVAKTYDGYYSAFKGNGAIPGFVFNTEEDAKKMQAVIEGEVIPDTKKLTLGDRIRTWKLATKNGNLNSMIIPIPQLWNAAVSLVASAVDAGEALVDALRKGYDHIKVNYKESWREDQYNREMMRELKAKGKFQYNLSGQQMAQASRIIGRVIKGANLVKEINAIRDVYDAAKAQLTDAQDIQDLEDSFAELQDYMFHTLAARQAEVAERVDLGLEEQTWWQKQKENWRDMHERLETVQRSITRAGLTIEEKNDMVNRADRWKSIAVAKIQDLLKDVGLSEVDVFIWKGKQKLEDSLFDRMAKAGVDYRQFNLYMYAKHAPERNAHNAKVRRTNLEERIVELEADIAAKEADYQLYPSSTLQGSITRLKNEYATLVEYEAMYGNPTANRDYVRLLEGKIPKKMHLMDDGGSGMTNQQAQEIIDAVDATGNRAAFEEFEREFREKVIDKLLDIKNQYGLVDQENYDYLKGYYQNYVPLRVEDDYFEKNLTFAQSKVPGAKIFASKGANYIGFERRINPVTQAIIDLQATVYEGEQNIYKKTIAEAIRTAPDAKVWGLQSATYAPIKDKKGRVITLKEIKKPDNGIPFMEDGMRKYLIIKDTALFKALEGTNESKNGPLLQTFANINNFFRQLFTVYNPAFTVTNIIRDMETAGAILASNYGPEVSSKFRGNVKQIFSIIRGSFKEQGGGASGYWAQRAAEYTALGGNMSWFRPEVSTELIKDIEGAYERYQKDNAWETGKQLSLKLADLFNKVNQSVETSTRLAIFDALIQTGTEPYKAAEIARNATVNFNKKGNFTTAANSLYLFFNASVQGTANMLYSLVMTKRGRYIAGGIAALGFIQSLMNNMLGDCNDPAHPENCYDNIPDYEKERNIIIKSPAGGFIKIPLAYGFNVFYNMGELAGQGMLGKTTIGGAAEHLFKAALNSFNPMGGTDTPILQQLSPTATDPVVQYLTNRDGLGRPIYSESFYDRRPNSQKGFGMDSPGAKNFADWLNTQTGGNEKLKGAIDLSPGTLDFMFETAFGGMGQFLGQTASTVSAAVDPEEDIELKKVPILNRFYTRPKEQSDRSMIFNKLDESYNTVLTQDEMKTFKKELAKAVRLGEIKGDKAEKYQKDIDRNQLQLRNPEVFSILETSKERELESEEVDAFIEKLEEMAERGEMSPKSIKGYKATITKNQNKLKPKEDEEE